MTANNVVGTPQPIAELAAITREAGMLFRPLDLLSFSSHKLYGPKGIGAFYVRAGVVLDPVVHGGGQERGLRSPAENFAGIVGLGEAAAAIVTVVSRGRLCLGFACQEGRRTAQ